MSITTDVLTTAELEDAIAGYLECAGWLVSDDEREADEDRERGCDTDAREGPFHSDATVEARTAVGNMLDTIGWAHDVREYIDLRGADAFGHDLWLTRNGHGAGFWDRGLGALGERLSDAARAMGEAHSYVDTDGVVRIDG